VDLESGDEDAFIDIRDEQGKQFPSNSCMDVVPKEVVNYLEVVQTLTSELEEHDALNLQIKKDIKIMNMGKNTINGTTTTKVRVLTKDCILHVSYMYGSIKCQNYILNVILNYILNIETEHDSHYNKNFFFLHENLDYNQFLFYF
jgi:hypothetical protein